MLRAVSQFVSLLVMGFAGSIPVVGTCAQVQDETEARIQRLEDAKLVEGLRRRRLFGIASTFCSEQLARPDLDASTVAALTVELIKTKTAEAMLSPPESRPSKWQDVKRTVNNFQTSHPDQPRTFLVLVQQALSHIAHGQLIRQELAAEMAGPSARESALLELREARVVLGDLEREIAKAIPERRSRNLGPHELNTEQLINLKKNVGYQLAVCNLVRAGLYDESNAEDRLNRMDALNRVTENLADVQRETSIGDPLWWSTKLSQIECLRLLGKLNQARALIETLPKPTTNIALQGVTHQKLQLAIEAGDANYSQSILQDIQQLADRSPEVDVALVELGVDLSHRSPNDQQKQSWLDFSTAMMRQVEVKHGQYWGRRAELILIGGAGGTGTVPLENTPSVKMNGTDPETETNVETSSQLELLIRLGDQAARKERLDDALKAYDKAISLAIQQGNKTETLRLNVKASKIHEQQSRHDLAASKLLNTSVQFPGFALAAPAHLRGCWNFARTIPPASAGSTANTDAVALFRKHLKQHLQIWPTSTTTDQVYLWLAGQMEGDKNWQEALNSYLSLTDSRIGDALGSIRAASINLLVARESAKQSTSILAQELIKKLLARAEAIDRTGLVSNELFLTAVELDLRFGSKVPQSKIEERLLTIAMSSETQRAKSKALNAVSVSLGDFDKAQKLISEAAASLNAMAIADHCLQAVTENLGSTRNESTERLLELRLVVIEKITSSLASTPGSQDKLTPWLFRKSDVLVSLNRYSESMKVLKELEKAYPKSASIQMQLARTVTNVYGTSEPEKAVSKWRQLGNRLKSRSENWFEAKYNVASLLLKSGKKEEAKKLLRYLNAIPPGWNNSGWKSKFEALLKQSQ